jgi:hypothetical protein
LDSYLANGAHFLGGTLFLSKPLVYRGLHPRTVYLTNSIVSMQQNLGKEGWTTKAPQNKREAVEAIFHNGVTRLFPESHLAQVLRAHFERDQITMIREACPEAYRLWQPSGSAASSGSPVRRAWRRITGLYPGARG